MATQSVIKLLINTMRRPGFWIITALLVAIAYSHYQEALRYPAFITTLPVGIGLSRHAFERVLLLAPITWAGFLFGWRGALSVSLVALGIMLPRVFTISLYPVDACWESATVFIIGNAVSFSFAALRRERDYRIRLEEARRELEAKIKVIEKDEKRLAALNQMSLTISQSLDLSRVLKSAIWDVCEVMEVDAAWIHLPDETSGKLMLAAYRGVSEEVARDIDGVSLEECFSGRVALSGKSLYVEDINRDQQIARPALARNQIQSLLIVPLMFQDRINSAALCVATRRYHRFSSEEEDLLKAIGNQISVAAENALLYQRQQQVAAALSTSEGRYRELFENAHEAIWELDREGRIIIANRACAALTGYSLDDMAHLTVTDLFSDESLRSVRDLEEKLLGGEAPGSPLEVNIVRNDRVEVPVRLSTSTVVSGGQISGFQYMARDITNEKRLLENQRYYTKQVTLAQEDERKRISRELHDGTVQSLVVLSRQLDSLITGGKGLSPENVKGIEKLWRQVNGIADEVRRLSQDLRPAALDRLGLMPALQWLVEYGSEYTGIKMNIEVRGSERRLDENVELVLFRVVQEALRNIWRHSRASKAGIDVTFGEREIRIVISDDGVGFKPPPSMGDFSRDGKLGLAGMQERIQLIGGSLEVDSQPGAGTTITIVLPLP